MSSTCSGIERRSFPPDDDEGWAGAEMAMTMLGKSLPQSDGLKMVDVSSS